MSRALFWVLFAAAALVMLPLAGVCLILAFIVRRRA